jgi:putative ABC transport system permease protein
VSATWLRWSWRDLRARWVQVAAIALVIALGTGSYAGLSSVTIWRIDSADASYEATNMYDLRARLPVGGVAPRGALLDALEGLSNPSLVTAAEERLLVPTQLDASTGEDTVLVRALLVGSDLSDGGPDVMTPWPLLGRALTEADAGRDVVLLERNFAKYYDLPPSGEVLLAGDRAIEYVGQATHPEYFTVVTETGGIFAQSAFAALFTSIETAQRLSGQPDAVNDLVLKLDDGASAEAIGQEVEALLRGFGATVNLAEDDPSYRVITEDPEGDQQFYNVFAIAIFGGAVFAAFNLTTRMVESQRREIGIAMAIGVPPSRIALRPLLFGLEIAVLGVIFGIGVGVLIAQLMQGLLQDLQPLPVFEAPFQFQLFAAVGLIGVLIPVLAILYPVLRAVRVNPIDAIKPTHLAARGSALDPVAQRLRLPGGTFTRLPFRNLLRAPRRALLTILGIAAVLSVLVGIVGMLDSLFATIDRSDDELLASSPDRLEIALDRFYPLDASQVTDVLTDASLGRAEPALQVGATLLAAPGDEDIDIFLDLVDLESPLWRPTVAGANDGTAEGIVLSEAAADDLGIGPGDTVMIRHPVRAGPVGFEVRESAWRVAGTHPHPFRFLAYMDIGQASLLGLEGATNRIVANPAPGENEDSVQRALFGLAGVASVQGVTATTDAIRDAMAEFTGIFQIIEGATLVLALLIAFNAASIGNDERARENATMLAYGIPVRTVLLVSVVESLVIGAIGTILGLIGGYALLTWTVQVLFPKVLPDIRMVTALTASSLVIVLALGILAVAAAPLLTTRRLMRMDIPSTLRVME